MPAKIRDATSQVWPLVIEDWEVQGSGSPGACGLQGLCRWAAPPPFQPARLAERVNPERVKLSTVADTQGGEGCSHSRLAYHTGPSRQERG